MTLESTKYENDVMRKLEAFKNAVEWSDFIGLLENLDTTLEKYKLPYIPHHSLLVKRLNQCLNQFLPPGVHLKTLETYRLIFSKLPRESLISDFTVLTLGLFVFGTRCRILVTNEYLDLLEEYIVPLVPDVPLSGILVGLLPTIESESLEFYDRTFLILVRLQKQADTNIFYNALWNTLVNYPNLHVSISNYLSKASQIILPDYKLVVKGVCCGLESDNAYTIRTMLDLVSYNFPLNITTTIDQDGRIIDIENSPAIKSSLETYNAYLNRAVLKLFLKKESAISKRLFKWFKIKNEASAPSLRNIGRGLGTLMNDSGSSSILILFKILFSLFDKVKLKPVILNMVLFDVISCIRKTCKDPCKYVKPFRDLGLDYIYRIFYLRIEACVNTKGNEDPETDVDEKASRDDDDIQNDDVSHLEGEADIQKEESDNETSINSKWTCDDILEQLIYVIKDLNAVDANAQNIHIPLLAYIIVKNRVHFDKDRFFRFLGLFFEHATYQPEKQASSIQLTSITEAYRTELFKEILSIDLVSLVADEYGRSCGNKEVLMNTTELRQGNICIRKGVLLYKNELLMYEDELSKDRRNGDTLHEMGNFEKYLHKEDVAEVACLENEKKVKKQANNNHHDGIAFSVSELWGVQGFIEKYSVDVFRTSFLDRLGAFLIRNYRYAYLIESLHAHINQEDLNESIWTDFVKTGIPTFLLFYDLSEYILKILHKVDRKFIFSLLSTALNQNKYFNTFFLLSTIGERETSEFTQLVLSINDPLPVLIYLLRLYNNAGTHSTSFKYTEQPNYNRISSILKLLGVLLDNPGVVKVLNANSSVSIDGFEAKGIAECVFMVLSSLIITEEDNSENVEYAVTENHGDGNEDNIPEEDSIREFNTNISKHANFIQTSSRKPSEFPNPYSEETPGVNRQRIQMEVFNLIDRLHHKGVSVVLPNMDRVKMEIAAKKDVFYIVIRSLFIVEDDVHFIMKNCLSNYNEVFFEISRISIKWNFFNTLVKNHEYLSLGMLIAMFDYVVEIPKFDWNEFYEISFRMICETLNAMEEDCVAMEHFKNNENVKCSTYEPVDSMEVYTLPAIQFCNVLYSHSHKLFIKYFKDLPIAENIFALVPFKKGLFTKMLSFENSTLLLKLVKYIQSHDRASIFITKNDYFKSSVYLRIDYSSTMLILYLLTRSGDVADGEENDGLDILVHRYNGLKVSNGRFRNGAVPVVADKSKPDVNPKPAIVGIEKYRAILENVLYALENRIISGIKLDLDFQHDLDILRAMLPLLANNAILINNYKSCLTMLLSTKRFRQDAFDILSSAIRRYPNSKPLSEELTSPSSDDFFKFSVFEKSELLGLTTRGSSSDLGGLLERFLNGLETSYFTSHLNNLHQKTQVLKKLSFLILSNRQGMFDSFADRLILAINSLIKEENEVKIETFRLCTVMVFRMDHLSINYLYPLILEEFMKTYEPGSSFIESTSTVDALVQLIDICMWLNSKVFDFKPLFMVNSTFSKCCISLSISRGKQKSPINIDYDSFLENGKYRNLISGVVESKDLSWYFKEAYHFYEYAEIHFKERDFERVEEILIRSFLEE